MRPRTYPNPTRLFQTPKGIFPSSWKEARVPKSAPRSYYQTTGQFHIFQSLVKLWRRSSAMIFSITLDSTSSQEIGLKFDGVSLSSLLCRDMTVAIFSHFGNVPLVNKRLIVGTFSALSDNFKRIFRDHPIPKTIYSLFHQKLSLIPLYPLA